MTYHAMPYQGSHAVGLDGKPKISPMNLPAAMWLSDLLNRDIVILGIERVSRAPQVSGPLQADVKRSGPKASVTAKAQNTAAGAGLVSSINS